MSEPVVTIADNNISKQVEQRVQDATLDLDAVDIWVGMTWAAALDPDFLSREIWQGTQTCHDGVSPLVERGIFLQISVINEADAP